MAANPKLPEQPQDVPTAIELWYLECLKRWWRAKKRGPYLHELAHWTRRSKTAVYSALVSLEHKKYTTRVADGGDHDRCFKPTRAGWTAGGA